MLVPVAFHLMLTRFRIQHHAFLVKCVAKSALVLFNSSIAATTLHIGCWLLGDYENGIVGLIRAKLIRR
jgi:hypothetical protein